MEDINQVTLIGRLTRDPELKDSVLPIRLAFTTRQKSGEVWEDRANYIDAVVFGRQAEALYPLLSKGTRVAIAGSLEWREYVGSDSQKRSVVQLLARNLQIMDAKRDGQPVASGAGHEDIPF